MRIETGIAETDRKNIAEGLSHLLADTYMLYVKTHNFHWNVTGPMFQTLHTMFETQYGELALAVDEIAERIRALGSYAPGSFTQFTKLAKVKEAPDAHMRAKDMILTLVQDHETLARTAREVYPHAEKADDEATADLATERIRTHEKTAWMLRALLED
jgi:starvation-inducible DNA-binding protein